MYTTFTGQNVTQVQTWPLNLQSNTLTLILNYNVSSSTRTQLRLIPRIHLPIDLCPLKRIFHMH